MTQLPISSKAPAADSESAKNSAIMSQRKKVCIIGGGSSGLIVMKELTLLGMEVICFERLPTIGGVYVKAYKNTVLTTSSLLTAWSDHSDGKESDPKFWTAEEYLEYLDSFAKKWDLYKYINFRHDVLEVKKVEETGKWLVTVIGGRACKDTGDASVDPQVIRCETYDEDPTAVPYTVEVDAISICTGTNTYSSLPTFPGQESFPGEIIHAENYRTPEKFQDKRESGSDIANEISKYASKCAIAIRGKHGHLIPRIQGNGRVTDLNTNRCRYSNPYVFGDWIGYVNQMAKKWLSVFAPDSDQKRVLRKIADLNMSQKTSAFSKFGCKNEGFVTAIVLRGAELHRDSFTLCGNKVVFQDGTEFDNCDAVVACTGYRNNFPFFDKYHPEIACAGCNPRTNYKQIFCIAHPGEVGFFGFARPAFGAIPPTTEMQARLWAMVLNGDVTLPSQEEMTQVAAADKLNWETRFGYDAIRVKGLVDFQLYCDGLAQVMGVMPPLGKLFWWQPKLWWKVMFGPFTMHQYRLTGPYAQPDRAMEVYSRQPVGDVVESVITASFLITAKLLSLLGFSKFRPNSF
eukprot:gene25455-34006_t